MMQYCRKFNLRRITYNNASEGSTLLRRRRWVMFDRIVCFSNNSIKTSTVTKLYHRGGGTVSRTQRRLLERRKRNKVKRKHNIRPITDSSANLFTELIQKSKYILNSLAPRFPGRPQQVSLPSLFVLCTRLPIFLLLSYAITDERISPYSIQLSLGPSMLPTIQFAGDIWLVETFAWERIWRRFFSSEQDNESKFRANSSSFNVGDLLIWENPKTRSRSCKRVIGVEGDTVQTYGEYRDLYQYRSDIGIRWPKVNKKGNIKNGLDSLDVSSENESGSSFQLDDREGHTSELLQTLVVPENCVWLEGDAPLLSLDSRQYGPIHVSKICGRLAFRLWPWYRNDLTLDKDNAYLSSCWVSRNRPVPYHTFAHYIGKRFNFYRISPTKNETQNGPIS